MPISTETAAPPELIVVGQCDVPLWGLSPRERHARAFRRAGVSSLAEEAPAESRSAVIVRADYILAEELVRNLVAKEDAILAVPGRGIVVAAHARAANAAAAKELISSGGLVADAAIPAGMRVLGPGELASAYNSTLRKRATPIVLSLADTPLTEVERRMFDAVYKGVTDFVTKWFWPRPARWVTRWAAAHRITPNTVTTVSLALVVLASHLFADGRFLLGVLVAWAMTFLDTVDGKLARLTLTSSRWGNVYDHGIDLIHPPFWWWAWWHGLGDVGDPVSISQLEWAFWIIIVGYVLGRIMEGVFQHALKIQTHVWRPIDSYFRTITARRNPNLAILTLAALFGRPDLGIIAVAAWTVISLIFHAVRLGQAIGVRLRGGEIRSWLSEPE